MGRVWGKRGLYVKEILPTERVLEEVILGYGKNGTESRMYLAHGEAECDEGMSPDVFFEMLAGKFSVDRRIVPCVMKSCRYPKGSRDHDRRDDYALDACINLRKTDPLTAGRKAQEI